MPSHASSLLPASAVSILPEAVAAPSSVSDPGYAEPLRRFHDRLAAKLKRKLPKRAVAGICERLLDRLRAVPARAYDRPAGEIEILIAGERLFGEIGEVLHRGDERSRA